MADCFSSDQIDSIFAGDQDRIQGQIMLRNLQKSPFLNILEGGTLENQTSETVRSVVQERSVLGTSLVKPVFVPDTQVCGVPGNQDKLGSTEYNYRLETYLGESQQVCVRVARNAFKGTWLRNTEALADGIVRINNADSRALFAYQSGGKFVAAGGYQFDDLFDGVEGAISTPFPNILPSSQMTFKALYKLGTQLKEIFRLDPFDGPNGGVIKVIAGSDQIESFRNELGVKADLLSLVTGQYKLGETSIAGYAFSGPYRGFAFGIDPLPLRATGITNGVPDYVEPEIAVPTTNGLAPRVNPAWEAAPYEVGFMVVKNTFNRLVPASFVGEGQFKWAPLTAVGALEWVIIRDCNNKRGDYGQFLYEIRRAYEPINPHGIIAFIYKRCEQDLGFATCVGYGYDGGLIVP